MDTSIAAAIRNLILRVERLERKEKAAGFAPGVNVTEGPDIDLVVAGLVVQVGRGLDTVLLADSGGNPAAEYAASDAGLAAALAAATAGDTVLFPSITITGGPWTVPAGVTLMGLDRRRSILSGQLTGGDGAVIALLSILQSANSGADLYCVSLAAATTLYLYDCVIESVQAGAGDAYPLYVTNGTLIAWGCELSGDSTSGSGWAVRAPDPAAVYLYHGRAVGTTEPFTRS